MNACHRNSAQWLEKVSFCYTLQSWSMFIYYFKYLILLETESTLDCSHMRQASLDAHSLRFSALQVSFNHACLRRLIGMQVQWNYRRSSQSSLTLICQQHLSLTIPQLQKCRLILNLICQLQKKAHRICKLSKSWKLSLKQTSLASTAMTLCGWECQNLSALLTLINRSVIDLATKSCWLLYAGQLTPTTATVDVAREETHIVHVFTISQVYCSILWGCHCSQSMAQEEMLEVLAYLKSYRYDILIVLLATQRLPSS